MNNYSVYKHTSPNGKVYIGITSQLPSNRWKSGYGYAENEYFFNAIMKYGWSNFDHEVLYSGLTEEEAKSKEIELISEYDSTNRDKGYNRSPGGDTFSEDSKELIKKTRAEKGLDEEGSKRFKGLWENEEFRAMMQDRMRGVKRTPEQKERYRVASTGRKHSDQTKKKLSEMMKERTGDLAIRSKRVLKIDPHTGHVVAIFVNARMAAKDCGMKNQNTMAQTCIIKPNRRHYRNGYYWCYEEDFDKIEFELDPELNENGRLKRDPNTLWAHTKGLTKEQKDKISKHNSKGVICIETGEQFQSLRQAAKSKGINSPELIGRQINGKISHAGGYHWRYTNG